MLALGSGQGRQGVKENFKELSLPPHGQTMKLYFMLMPPARLGSALATDKENGAAGSSG